MGPWCAASLYVAPLRFLVRPLQLPPGPLERSGCFRCTPSLAARCDSDMVVGFLPWCALTQVANEVDLRLAAGQPVVQTQDTSPAALKPPAQVEMTRAAAPAAHGVEK